MNENEQALMRCLTRCFFVVAPSILVGIAWLLLYMVTT